MRVGRTTYTYDNAGRVIRTVTKRLSRKPLVHEFFYATNEQPIGFTSSDNKQVGWRYIYDSYGRRVAKEAINTTTGAIEGRATQTLYGTRTWTGRTWTGTYTSPLLIAGQYEDAKSGWAFNRFRYYNPVLGAYNAQDPLGQTPRLASAQGYVDHAAHWFDYLGLQCHQVTVKELQSMPEFQKLGLSTDEATDIANWLNGRNTDSYLYSHPTPNRNEMQYIGMSNDPARRAIEHGKKFSTEMEIADIDTNLLSKDADSFTRRQARAFEQAAIDSKGLNNLANARNQIGSTPPAHVKNGAVAWANGMINKSAITIPFF